MDLHVAAARRHGPASVFCSSDVQVRQCMWQQHMALYSTSSWGILQHVQAVSTAGQRN
jgi:hypothetical protein